MSSSSQCVNYNFSFSLMYCCKDRQTTGIKTCRVKKPSLGPITCNLPQHMSSVINSYDPKAISLETARDNKVAQIDKHVPFEKPGVSCLASSCPLPSLQSKKHKIPTGLWTD